MSNEEFENYLKLIGKLLQLSKKQQSLIGIELRDHLQSRTADLMEAGMSQQAALSQALEEFGDATVMAQNFQFVSSMKRKRWMMRFATLSIAGLFVAVVMVMSLWPENARFGAPDRLAAGNFDQDDEVLQESIDPPVGAMNRVEPDGFAEIRRLNEHIESALRKNADVMYEEADWEEVSRDLSERFGFNIITDTTAIDDGLGEGETISIYLRGLPLEVCLSDMLVRKNSTFIVRDGSLRVILLDNADDDEFMVTKIFDCRDIIERLDLTASTSDFNAFAREVLMTETSFLMSQKLHSQKLQERPKTTGGGGGMGGGMFQISDPAGVGTQDESEPSSGAGAPSTDEVNKAGKTEDSSGLSPRNVAWISAVKKEMTKEWMLTHLVKSFNSPHTWVEEGGNGEMRVVNGFLVVLHSRATQRKIGLFLDSLRSQLP